MSDRNILRKHGERGTFIVRVQHRQNSSWQGRITWMEQDKTLYFRSVWEMIKLIASVVETTEEMQEVSWFEEGKKLTEDGEQYRSKTKRKRNISSTHPVSSKGNLAGAGDLGGGR